MLNRIALYVVERQRGIHLVHVFTYNGKPVTRMLNTTWLRARRTETICCPILSGDVSPVRICTTLGPDSPEAASKALKSRSCVSTISPFDSA